MVSRERNKSSIAEDYQKALEALSWGKRSSREEIVEQTGLSMVRVNQMLILLEKNHRLIKNRRWLKDLTRFSLRKRKDI